MAYDKHLFISYAHLDDQPLTPEQEGWVSRFHESLQSVLTIRMGQKAKIWRDKKLSGNDVFADEIISQFPKTEILVSVLSKCYVESEWCRREVEEFCRSCGELRVGNKYRIIKVVKLPVERVNKLPPVMNEMLGYDFFTYQDQDQKKTALELDPLYFPKSRELYVEKLCSLSDDIIDMVNKMEAQTPAAENTSLPPSSRPAVFVAQCSWDQKESRETLIRDLRQHGYPILPDRTLPSDEEGFKAETARLLEQCALAVHLVGPFAGLVPDGPSGKSTVVLQNELAISRSKTNGLPRVIWLPDGTSSQDPDQARFIQTLHSNAEAQFGADLITGDLQDLKAAVHCALQKTEKIEPLKAQAKQSRKLIYLVCDQTDRESVLPLRKSLMNKGFEIKIPLFDGDAAALDQARQEMLSQCDIVIVFYGKGSEGWKHSVDGDLLKSKGHRDASALPLQLTYLSSPATTEKSEMIQLEEPNVINGLEGFSENVNQTLLQALQRV